MHDLEALHELLGLRDLDSDLCVGWMVWSGVGYCFHPAF